MTDAIDSAVEDYFREQIERAAAGSRVHLYTPSVLQAAAEAFEAVQDALEEHDIADPFGRRLGSLASRILSACHERFALDGYYATGVDPIALLHTAVDFAADRIEGPFSPLEGPAMADCRAEVAYVVLPRQPGTPAWGKRGDAPLVVTLGRPDRAADRLIASSGGGPLGEYEPGPWTWCLDHKVPGGIYISHGTRVIAPEPSHETAGELAAIIADVLNGDITLPN
ncbi:MULTISPECIES: hypothetical protein [Actinomadura]|uniref:Uncharacterized protein n=2 Tax=Actinomadura yumaensis TaxID=111807 RepID=A0ABW2CUU1_9ACTN|nr:hypothetical protein [Actinomadura sp. J1-007]MWK40580.1 hypothetical protein [Actinomadura sp. J1-007]